MNQNTNNTKEIRLNELQKPIIFLGKKSYAEPTGCVTFPYNLKNNIMDYKNTRI